VPTVQVYSYMRIRVGARPQQNLEFGNFFLSKMVSMTFNSMKRQKTWGQRPNSLGGFGRDIFDYSVPMQTKNWFASQIGR
jgi:hypothetical protein